MIDQANEIIKLRRRIAQLERPRAPLDMPGVGGSTVVPVKITSGGPGATYTGAVYGNGPDEIATETGVTIKQMLINSAETIPAGTPALAVRLGSTYYIQVPVWLSLS